jgi:pimeloyl-ACP methyl ester carboxylesterase
VLLVAEPRFKAAVLVAGGYQPVGWLPEVESRRYAPYVKMPVLMLNGSYDAIHSVKSSQIPMFRHLGSADKQHKLLPSGHVIPADQGATVIDEWLKSRLGSDRPPDSN